jgi:hypothetical protein
MTGMIDRGSSNYHVDYVDVTQHWHSQSQPFAGGDSLVTAIFDDWLITSVSRETHWFAGMRSVSVYTFELKRGDETQIMPVIHTPYVTSLIRKINIPIVDVTKNQQGCQTTSTND